MRHKLSYFTVIIMLIAMFLSCQQPNNEVPIQEYSTPTIKGTLSLPAGSTVNPGDIYVKVIDSTGATAKVQKANSDKTFVVQGLNADMSYSILFSSVEPEFTNRSISRDPDKSNGVGGWIHDVKPAIKEGNDIGSVKLKPLGTIRGKALIDGKAEHYDTTVYIPGTSYIAMTSADGTFAIYNVPEGTYTLRYTHEGYMPIMTEGVILTCPEDAENPEITTMDVKLVSSSGTVEGVALFDGLTSHSGITIKLESEDRNKAAQASTSEDGSYIFNDVAPGVYRVIVSASGYVSMSSGYFTVESATLTSVPERTVLYRNVGSVKGTVKLSDSQADSSGIVVSFVSNEDSFTAVTDNDGYFSRSLKPGSYTVTASYPGYTSQSLDVTVTENALTEINLPSLPLASGAVAGFVVLAGSEDFSGVVITLTNSTAMTESYTAVTAADGSFRFTGLNKGGTYLLTYSKDGYVSDNSKSIDVTVGSVANAGSVTLKSTFATVKGTIQLEGASSYENVTILLKNDKNQYTSTTDQKGGYVVNRVLPGTYTLLASKDGYVSSVPVNVVIEPSSEKTIETKSLAVAIRSVTGSVTLELLSDYSGALVTATNLSDNTLVYSAITNSSGDFTLAGMKPGEYSVVISCNGYRSVMLPTINIVSSSTTNLSVTNMLVNRGTVSGTVTLEGRSSSSGIKVELLRGSEVYAESTTDESGNYSFYVPQGNYSGVRYSNTDFASVSVSRNIALFADNYVSMGDTVLQATHNTVNGRVDVLTTDNEGGVTISFDGVASIPAVTTSASGEFSFDHIQVGSYVLRFRRTNCSDITVPVEVKAADVINLGTVTITPNTATIKGTVILKDGLSSSDVTVSVDMGGGMILSTITDNSGRYELGGISVADEYRISYSKNGWKSDSQTISPKLSALEERELQDIILIDNTSPTINNVVINAGSTFTDNPKLNLKLFAQDEGSGIDSYSIQIKKRVDGVESSIFPVNYLWQSFEQNVVFDLAQLPNSVYTGNGTYVLILAVKDKTGNISTPINNEVIITNNATSLTGQLRGEYLHLTKNRSPYVIEGNCTVGPEDTLIIDPGCEIRFAGDYSLYVAGKINAVGSDEERIVFTKSEDFNGRWKTIALLGPDAVINNTVEYKEGSIVQNCDFEYAEVPLALSCAVFVDSCSFQNSGELKITANPTILNSYLGNGVRVDNSGHGTASLINNIIEESLAYGYMNVVHLEYNTINNANVYIATGYYYNGWIFAHNKLIKSTMKFEVYLNTEYCSLNYNSFEECEGLFITYNLSSHDFNTVDYSKNYWGAARTEEIIAKGNFSDLSFIYDWFDDSNQPRVHYDDWLEEEPEFVGYQGDAFNWNLLK